MTSSRPKSLPRGTWTLLFALLAGSGLSAQTRLVLPEGSVIIVRTSGPLESATAKVGQTFETVVADTVRVDNYTVIPAGSRIRGVVTFAQAADRQRSGVIEVNFDRLSLPDGKGYTLSGKLTSTDRGAAADRVRSNARVVLVGGRGGVGAANRRSRIREESRSGSWLRWGICCRRHATFGCGGHSPRCAARTRLVLSRRGTARAPDAFTIYNRGRQDPRRAAGPRAAELLSRQHQRTVDDATQRALFEFRSTRASSRREPRRAHSAGPRSFGDGGCDDASILSGGRVASATGRTGSRRPISSGTAISASGASMHGRPMQKAISTSGSRSPRSPINASLYEQSSVFRQRRGSALAGKALVGGARRVDAALQRARTSSQIQNAWSSIARSFRTGRPYGRSSSSYHTAARGCLARAFCWLGARAGGRLRRRLRRGFGRREFAWKRDARGERCACATATHTRDQGLFHRLAPERPPRASAPLFIGDHPRRRQCSGARLERHRCARHHVAELIGDQSNDAVPEQLSRGTDRLSWGQVDRRRRPWPRCCGHDERAGNTFHSHRHRLWPRRAVERPDRSRDAALSPSPRSRRPTPERVRSIDRLGTGLPARSSTLIATFFANGAPTVPVCVLPPTIRPSRRRRPWPRR